VKFCQYVLETLKPTVLYELFEIKVVIPSLIYLLNFLNYTLKLSNLVLFIKPLFCRNANIFMYVFSCELSHFLVSWLNMHCNVF